MIAERAARLADEVVHCDALVVGTGVAGLSTALGLAPRRVVLLTKTELARGSASSWAQGGVAAAMADDDSPALHARDTLVAGAGLGDDAAVDALTREGPASLRRLLELGADFDRDARGRLRLGREGAHGRRRILHADGDATGAEMVRALVAAVRREPSIEVREGAFAHDLVLADGRVVGVLARLADRTVWLRAGAVVLACGGLGRVYARTTNPVAATGDGLAMAARAGALLADLELIQFHPTALDAGLDPLPLVTEALRGEGAVVVDERGERFLASAHPDAELAPRDIVARAIRRRQQAGGRVFLDARHLGGLERRFPTVFDHCRGAGVDPRRQPIPVTPAAHYAMAGVAVDLYGRTSLHGLWACGEVAASGVHGANRLASNSLLEGLVYGARVALDVDGRATKPTMPPLAEARVWRESPGSTAPTGDAAGRVRRAMWRDVGLERAAAGLRRAQGELRTVAAELPAFPGEVANLCTVGRLIAAAAEARRYSLGAHYRADSEAASGPPRRAFWFYRPAGASVLAAARPFPAAAREIA